MLLDHEQSQVAPDARIEDREALIREARRRTRRRWARRVASVAGLVGIPVVAYAALGGGSGGVIAETATQPYANLRAFKGQGDLAFVSRGELWVLDGTVGTLRRLPVPVGNTPSSPAFSHDGRWLAYLTTGAPDSYGPYELWIARADGTGAHHVRSLVVNQFVGWSSSADLAAVAAGESKHVPYGSPTAVDLVSPAGGVQALFTRSSQRVMATRGGIWSVVWSPDGRSLAVSTYSPYRDAGTQILDVPVAAGARSTVWFSIHNPKPLTGGLSCGPGCAANQAIAELAGWWPKWGITFWVFTGGMTIAVGTGLRL
jgi:hypothetical protein